MYQSGLIMKVVMLEKDAGSKLPMCYNNIKGLGIEREEESRTKGMGIKVTR